MSRKRWGVGATGSGRMGLNFVVIKVGLHNMPPLMLAGLRFMLVAFPAIFCRTTESTTEFAAGVWINHQFCAVCFSFCAINFGMPAGLASLVLQAQAFLLSCLARLLSVSDCMANNWRGSP